MQPTRAEFVAQHGEMAEWELPDRVRSRRRHLFSFTAMGEGARIVEATWWE
jgi:hypothetical protein